MSLKFGSAAHVALEQLAAKYPKKNWTAPEIVKAVVSAGFQGSPKSVIAGDHAVQPNGAPANEKPACNCSRDQKTALFTQTGGRGLEARYASRIATGDKAGRFEGNPKFAAKAPEVLPWLVKYAVNKALITYGELGKLVGLNPHTELKHVLAIIGTELAKLDPQPPPLQLIVINKKGLIGDQGLGWLLSDEEAIKRFSPEKKKILCTAVHESIFAYPNWGEILVRFGLEPVSVGPSLEAVLKEMAASHYGQGGESEDHRVLKEYVKAHPECIGLKHAFTSASTERLLLSGDEIDVFFCSPTKWVCIEVKSLKSNQNDILRGIFQCVKYKAVLEAEQVYLETAEKPAINVCLVLSSTLQDDLQRVAKLLDIPVESNITVPSDFIPPSKKI